MDTLSYQNAANSLRVKDYRAAERAFRKTLDSISEGHKQYYKVLSCYGLSQVLNDNDNGLLLCRDAASNEMIDGDVFLNLACAEWYCDHRKRAVEAVRHGIKVDASNVQLNRACAQLDCRKKCLFSFLPRSHKLNQLFGKLVRRRAPVTTVHMLLFS